MTAARYDITIERNANFLRTITWSDENQNLIDLTGYSAKMQIRPSANSPEVWVEASTANGLISLGGVNGKISIDIPPSEFDAIKGECGEHDLILTSGNGIAHKLIYGKAQFIAGVTK